MPNQFKFLADRSRIADNINLGNNKRIHKTGDTEITFYKLGTKEILAQTHNRVLIAGSQFTAMKHFNKPPLIQLPTYNQSLNLENSETPYSTPENTPVICLFCCGTGGCGTENSQVYTEKYTGRIDPTTELVPFRYQQATNDLPDNLRNKYFGRKESTDGSRISYYFKAFETEPTFYANFLEGNTTTPIDANLYESTNESDAEFYVEMMLQITKEDFRDYFSAVTGINDARINSISLLTAWYTTDASGYKWYQDIIPMTQLNIPNEPLIDLTKGIDITYHIYY